jgi:hypothetical protein
MSPRFATTVLRSVFLVGLTFACRHASGSRDDLAARLRAAGDAGFGVDSVTPQPASPEDIHIFDPYIGRFQSKQFHDAQRGTDLRYLVEYAWFDSTHAIVRFSVSTLYLDDGTRTVNAEGFYGYDPFAGRLYTFGAFSSGLTGFGAVGEFDRTTGRRVTWARSRGQDGVTTWVRDAFELVDPDTWTDVTSIRRSDGGDWRVVYRDRFTRIRE